MIVDVSLVSFLNLGLKYSAVIDKLINVFVAHIKLDWSN